MILILALACSFIMHASHETPEFLSGIAQNQEFIKKLNAGLPDNKVIDCSRIDEQIMKMLHTFNDGYQRKKLLEAINFETVSDEILTQLKKESETLYTPYNQQYWEKNQLIKTFLANPDAAMTITHSECPDELSYTVTYYDILKKVLEHQIIVYAYTILWEKIMCYELYNTGLQVSRFKTFLTPSKLEKNLVIVMRDENNPRIELKIPKTILSCENKALIDAHINQIPMELLVPYTDGLLHSCTIGLVNNNNHLRKTPRDCKLLPIFAKDSGKLLGISAIFATELKKNKKDENHEPIQS
jgi:hypothetical protein